MITLKEGRMIDAVDQVRVYGRRDEIVPLPNLVEIQTQAYEAFLAWVFFGEVPGYTLFAGGALILYGVYLAITEKAPGR